MAAVALALCAPAASAATWTVRDGEGTCGTGDNACSTIQQAADAAGANDTIQIFPGFYAGAIFADANMTVQGTGSGLPIVLGTLTFNESATLQRMLVSATTANTPAVQVNGGVLPRTVTIESSVLSGNGTGAGIAVASLPAATTVTGRHVTMADSGTAPPTALSSLGASVTFSNSIVLGGGAVPGTNNDTDNNPAHRAPGGPDTAPPSRAITSRRRGQSVKLGARTPALRGRTSDASGVRRVELALMRRQGRRCLWYDGRRTFRRGPCRNPVWFRVVIDDFAWRYTFPRRVRPLPGSYVVLARAIDMLGNRTARTSGAAGTAISFRYRR